MNNFSKSAFSLLISFVLQSLTVAGAFEVDFAHETKSTIKAKLKSNRIKSKEISEYQRNYQISASPLVKPPFCPVSNKANQLCKAYIFNNPFF